MAYLIHIVGLSREVAKALIIDSAAGWNRQDNKYFAMGYGVVPKRIEDITHSKDDEIRFIMNGTIDEYETYTYNIPVPQDMHAHPFLQRQHWHIFRLVTEIKGLIIQVLKWTYTLGES